jgi:heme-degrading monooxygenase HmoA
MAALPQTGYVSGETLINTENRQVVTVISTWKTLEDWRKWESSEQRAKINEQIEPLLSSPSNIETYELLSA